MIRIQRISLVLLIHKRSKKKKKEMPNELYRTDNNDRIIIDDGKDGTILDLLREINWD